MLEGYRKGSLGYKLIRYFGIMLAGLTVLAIINLFLVWTLRNEGQALSANFNSQTMAITAISVGMILYVLVIGDRTLKWLKRDLLDPLNALNLTLGKIVGGDLRVQLPSMAAEDEIADLFRQFDKLLLNLKDDRKQIHDAVTVLSNSVGQIISSTSASATGASATAGTVTETTIAAEEVRQTTMVATENSRFVADLAEETAKVSLEGRQATEDTVGQMTRMREQMATIAESMSGLLEKSQAIVEITSTVDDLAQQSNLLAVNAAVEAARAGELGKGFSVVAQEVKALAALSKEATAEVRRILDDIQRATAAAAVSIEQGSGMVEAAVKQSSEAGNAIEALTKSVSEAASAASQIAAANQEQLIGIDQVVTAMQGIQQAMRNHAESSKEIDKAAQNLNIIRDALQILVNRYQA
ncbi:MAG: methyl-accepting chemotaxis protein [Candidatus Obscuribacterales bacterium]|nr:methyl-accepting chemotaxis protein [Candidatus Obscuribacterales bacterium]